MKLKNKFGAIILNLLWWSWRAKKIKKKNVKGDKGEVRYSQDWIISYLHKKAKKLLKMLNVELEIIGYDNVIKSASLIVANHSSLVDSIILFKALEDPSEDPGVKDPIPTFLAKQEIKNKKIISGVLDLMECFYIDRKNVRKSLETLLKFGKELKTSNKTGIIFPEGTRSRDGKVGEFFSSPFAIAQRFFLPIIPVTINNSSAVLDTNRTKKIKVEVIFHKQIKPISFITMNRKELASKIRNIVVSDYKVSKSSFSKLEKMG